MKFSTVLAVASLSTLVAAPMARADESASTLLSSADGGCAQAAARAVSTETAALDDVMLCTSAVASTALNDDGRAAMLVNRGTLYMARGNPETALRDFDAALALRPDFSEALADRGAAHQALHQPGAAVGDLTLALQAGPVHPKIVYYNRAIAREDSGDAKGAYLDYLKAAQLDPAWTLPRTQLARFTVARLPQG